MNNTFDHEKALSGAPVECGDEILPGIIKSKSGSLISTDFWDIRRWRIDGTPLGDYPPLTTKPNGDEAKNPIL